MITEPTVVPADLPSSPHRRDISPALVLEGVTRRWGAATVLDELDLAVAPGQLAWVGGANGAGKTTLLRIASGLILPHAGRVRLCGFDPEDDRRAFHRQLGFLVAGDRGLYARLTVLQNLDFAAALALLPKAKRRTAVASVIDQFDLNELARRRVDRMSMGQRQRARLAMAFVHDPTVVLLDEPRTSLDASGINLLASALDRLTRRGGAAVWCSPAGDEPPIRIDRSYMLAGGKLTPC